MFRQVLAAVGLSSHKPTSPAAAAAAVDRDAPEPSATAIGVALEPLTGSHVVTIEGYSRTKGLGNGHSLCCTFDAGGCCWSMYYYPDGFEPRDAGSISFTIAFVRCYNIIPLAHRADVRVRCTLHLLDVNGDPVCSSSRGPRMLGPSAVRWSITPWQWHIWRKRLEWSRYLRDDCLRVRCDITVYKFKEACRDGRFAVVVPPPDVGQRLGRLLASGEGADVAFEVAGEMFPAHRCILAARSPVFMAELFGPMKEKTATCVTIEDMEASVFRALLHFVYTDSLPEVDEDDTMAMTQHLLVAADRYGLDRLKLICEDKLCSYVDPSTVVNILALAEQHTCLGLKAACFKFLKYASNKKAAIATDDFEHLANSSPSILEELDDRVPN